MDLVLHIADEYLLDTVWTHLVPSSSMTSAWPRDYIPRQLLSLVLITMTGIHLLYFIFAGLSYKFIFNHDMMQHPRFIKNQIRFEIQSSLNAFPGMTLLTLPWFQAEVLGYSRLYDNVSDYGWPYLVFSVPLHVPLSLSPPSLAHAHPSSASWSSPTTSCTGFIVPCTIPCSTKLFTSRITSG